MAASRPQHRAPPGRVPTRCVAALCAACFLLGVCVVNRYWAVPEPPDCRSKANSGRSRAMLSQAQTREVVIALDRTISDIEMRLAAARAAQMRSQGVSPSDSAADQGNMRPRLLFVMGIMTTFNNRRRRDSIRKTWMPEGEGLRRLEKDKGIVMRFVIGRSANPGPDSEVERAMDAEDKEYNDILRLNHVEGQDGLPLKIQMFLSTALSTWDADFYVKVDDDVHVNIGMPTQNPLLLVNVSPVFSCTEVFSLNTGITRSILARHRSKPRVYIGCMKSGPVIANNESKYYEPDHWKFGTAGNNYFRHATRQLYAITRDLATYVSANKHILHKYTNEDVSFGSWLIGLDVEHVDERSLCCGIPPDCEWKAQAGNPCGASFDWNCSGVCNPAERMEEVHRQCWEHREAALPQAQES
ncbi:beta-1,6-galactosyltransferase GALT31A-like isoform X1 [Triticum urartu]|uniref:beta-1,6-galactosyltransferase GALT31A-like isoform X1 n=1 Tax=Triticum urartu TaxID=4572 RepID=UPI002043FA9D|nr:beta-1,6-galactosyltransferase GALT31A-like isoform X1 [Triticum urartu]XP_048544651.1 beta-1,6-galactosyltransferase GALT31A-like isoform X1 [Triticum urartu]XP_048547833.1 beta-1,6-galactosyltransferase GALT31A-like isoform X1 [Triticum urartu]